MYTYFKMMKLYMFAPVSGMYSCPLAMTDGATRTIEVRIISITSFETHCQHTC